MDALDAAGELTHIKQSMPDGVAPQKLAANYASTHGVFQKGDWVMWLDLDEYLFVNSEDHHLDSLIRRSGSADAVSVAWRFFGDNGNETWPGRQIAPQFTSAERRSRKKRPQVKTLFRFDERISSLDIHRPKLVEGIGPEEFNWISISGKKVDPLFFASDRSILFNRITDGSRFYSLGQVLHFSIRTPDIFEKRAKRGDGYYPADENPVVRDARFLSPQKHKRSY